MDIGYKSATELVADIAAGEISSRELTEHYIDRIERYDGAVNAVVVRDFEGALAAADEADAQLARGERRGPLHGLPMTVKEAYDVTGMPTTWGIPLLANNIATSDAAYVTRLKEAGAHLLGKTNVPLNLADFQSYNEIYGQTGNPWDVGRTPGGSSGGSSAALAAGLTGLEAGSDIGGSIRNPAHFCGIYGHKPTWGVVPPQGHSLPGDRKPPDIAVIGPMARSAEDLALSMQLVAGADVDNAAGWQLNLPAPTKTRLADFRIAVWPTHELAPVAAEVAARVEEVAGNLEALGADVHHDARPDIDFKESQDVYIGLLQGVMAEGVIGEEREQMLEAVAALPVDDTSMNAMMMRGAVQDHGTWLKSHNQRYYLREAWRAFFADFDILICPQTATPAFPHNHSEPMMERTLMVDNVEQSYWQQLFWAGTITVAHLPSTVFPTGLSSDGLPIGLQAVGAEFNDYTTIEFARLMGAEFGGFQPPPDFP